MHRESESRRSLSAHAVPMRSYAHSELFREPLPFFEGAHDRRATGRLHRHHSRPLRPDPSHLFHLFKRFPHPDQSRAAAGWIDDHVGQLPLELFGKFVTHRLLAFDSVRLFQSRNVEPAFGFFAPRHFSAAVCYQARPSKSRARRFVRIRLCLRAACRVGMKMCASIPRTRSVRGQSAGSIPADGTASFCTPSSFAIETAVVMPRALKALRRVLRFVLD